jgi:hypothetical protein
VVDSKLSPEVPTGLGEVRKGIKRGRLKVAGTAHAKALRT